MLKICIAESGPPASPSFKRLAVVCLFSMGLAASLALPTAAMAQSGTRTVPQQSYQPAPSRSAPPAGSQTHSMAPQAMASQGSQTQPMATQGSSTHNSASGGSQSHAAAHPVALGGYCPVCIISLKKWVKGSPEYQVAYDGKTYLFPDEKVKQMFVSDPAKWVPAMGGDCTVCKVNLGQKVPGSIQFSSLFNDRLYLFPSEVQKQAFGENPGKYATADVAMGGKCSVCRVELNQEIEGNPDFTTFHQGKRYWFPGAKQQSMFVANPGKYAE